MKSVTLLWKTLLFLFFCGLIAVGGLLLYVRFVPLNISYVATKLLGNKEYGLSYTFDELWLTHDGKFSIIAKNVAFSDDKNGKLGGIEHLKIRFANRSLALLHPSPKHIEVDGLYFNTTIGRLPLFTDTPPKPDYKNTSYAKVMASLAAATARMRFLKTTTLNNINLTITDLTRNVVWTLTNGTGQGSYYGKEGLKLAITGDIAQNNAKKAPVSLSLSREKGAKEASITVKVADVKMNWFRAYIPPTVQRLVEGNTDVLLGAKWSPKKGLSRVYFNVGITDVMLTWPRLYTQPVALDSLETEGYYLNQNNTLFFQKIVFKQGRSSANLSGNINSLGIDNNISLEGIAHAHTAKDIIDFLPNTLMPKLVPWLSSHIKNATLSQPITVSINGPARTLMPCAEGAPCAGIAIKGVFDKGEFLPTKALPWLKLTEPTTLHINKGALYINTAKATLSDQTATNISVTIAPIFTRAITPKIISVSHHLEGPVATTLPWIATLQKQKIPYRATGTHSSDIALTLTAIKGTPVTLKTADISATSRLKNISLSPNIAGKKMRIPTAKATLKVNTLTFDGQASWGNFSTKTTLKYALNTQALSGKIRTTVAVKHLPMPPLKGASFGGYTTLSATINRPKRTAPITLDATANLAKTTFSIPHLNWEKKAKTPLMLKIQGQITPPKTSREKVKILADWFTLTGKDTEVAGSFSYYPATKKSSHSLQFQLQPFNVGRTNTTATYANQTLTLKGQQLDISHLLESLDLKNSKLPPNFKLDAELGTVFFKQGQVNNIRLMAMQKNGLWHALETGGTLDNKQLFSLQYIPLKEGGYKLTARLDDVGHLIKTLGISEKVIGGRLVGDMRLNEKREGSGTFQLGKIQLINTPILVQILSLLSLEQLFSSEKGITFDKGTFPITKKGNHLQLDNARLHGPSMAMRLSGYLNPSEKYVNIDGDLAPTAGLNRFVSKIPLVGSILTGSQEGLFVANFKVKGPWKAPDVSVNPIKSITPGLIKDFFGILKGK